MTDTITGVLDRIEAEQANARRQINETDPLAFLKAVYMNADLPLSVRMRAAIEVLPFTHPKLAVTAQVSENDFAALLDQRIKRLQEAKLIEHQPQVETKPLKPRLSGSQISPSLIDEFGCAANWLR
jgi:hypothetical protein